MPGAAPVRGMELARILQAVLALRLAREGEDFVLLSSGVIEGILRVLAAEVICLVDACTKRTVTLVLWPLPIAGQPCGTSPWGRRAALAGTGSGAGAGHTLVMPLPTQPGGCRRLVFARPHGRTFSDEDRSAAILLQPHIADALRCQSRHAAARLLTGRQRELLRLVAAGHDNVEIAQRLGLSPYTVRKHLENAFARLNVTSRTAAVARVCPDAGWLEPLAGEPLRSPGGEVMAHAVR